MTEHTKCHLLDMELAQYVMNWTFVEPHIAKVDPPDPCDFVYTVGNYEPGGPYVYYRPYGAGDFDRWSPTEFDADALDVVKAIQATPRYVSIFLHPTGVYTCSIDPVWIAHGDEHIVGCNSASTLRQAICDAAEEWLRMREKNT